MRILLTVMAGPHKGLEFSFDRHDTFLVGRSKHAHFQLPAKDKYFSRLHFMMEVNPPQCRLIDMGSHNGTFVNGEKVLSADLKDNDQIRAGHTVLRVKVVQTSPTDAAATISFHREPETALPVVPGLRVEREIGRGALGVTYLARRLADAAPAAVKVIRPSCEGSRPQVEAFLQAARFLTQLEHPNIVRLRELGVCATGFYFVSEYVTGLNASQRVQRDGPLAIKRAVRWANQILLALHHAHGKHFIHRDIKPTSVLIQDEGGKEVVKLADFGLARVYHAAPFSGLALSADVLRLASFMAPEILFRYQEANPLADQYSVAALMYYLLTGEQVLHMPAAKEKRYTSLLRRQYVPIRERRPEVSAALASVIHKALARPPAQRFGSALEFRQALARAVPEE